MNVSPSRNFACIKVCCQKIHKSSKLYSIFLVFIVAKGACELKLTRALPGDGT